tara:strand:- start:1110 stop:1952 length:843 start_codon:yes stop_codon:yes gene_type:complete
MEDTQSPELASDTTQDGLGTSDSTQSQNGLVEQAASQETSTEDTPLSALEQDSRYATYFKNGDQNTMYDHIKTLESKQAESQQAVKELETLRQDYSSAQEQLNSYNGLLEDPTTGPIYQQAINTANEAIAKARYGDLPPSALTQLSERDNEMHQLREQMQRSEDRIRSFEDQQIGARSLDSIKQKASEYGIDPNIDGFLRHAQEHNIPVDAYEREWNTVAQKSIIEAAVKKAIEANTVAKKETMNGTVYSPSTASNQTPSNSSGREPLSSILNRIRGQAV